MSDSLVCAAPNSSHVITASFTRSRKIRTLFIIRFFINCVNWKQETWESGFDFLVVFPSVAVSLNSLPEAACWARERRRSDQRHWPASREGSWIIRVAAHASGMSQPIAAAASFHIGLVHHHCSTKSASAAPSLVSWALWEMGEWKCRSGNPNVANFLILIKKLERLNQQCATLAVVLCCTQPLIASFALLSEK